MNAPTRSGGALASGSATCPSSSACIPDLTVGENVDFAASLYGLVLWRRWRRRRAVLKLLELWDVRGRRAGRLSGGMQRRLELAAALVHEPDLLILDEPTAGIDPLLRRTVWDEIHRLRDGGVTTLVTTQYVTEAEECTQVALISGGRLIAFGTPDAVRRSAFGGEVVEVSTEGMFDAAALSGTPGIHGVRQTGPRAFELVVDDAGEATADAVELVTAAGGKVGSVRAVRPSFESVFTELVERDRAEASPAATTEPGREAGAEVPPGDQAAAA